MKRAREHIAPGLGDDDVPVVDVRASAGDGGMVTGESDTRGADRAPAPVTVVSGEEGGITAALCVPVHNGLEAEALAVYEQDGEQECADKDGNADQINVLVR